MSLKEIIKAKQGSHVVGAMYRIAELAKKNSRASSRLVCNK